MFVVAPTILDVGRIFLNFISYFLSVPCNSSQVQGSTFRVKEKEGIKASKSQLNFSFFQIIANLAPNFEFGLTKLTLFS